MSKPDLDWTFDHIPSEVEAATAPSPARPAPRPPAAPTPRRPRPRWLLPATLLTLVALAALGIWLVYAFGWQRVRGQINAEIAYEDEQSLAGNSQAVRAVQAADSAAWVELRAAEAAAGYPTYLPAENLLPAGSPPEVMSVSALGAGLVEAQVLRRFADSAGSQYTFEYRQRYRNLGPGLWERLPPDEAALAATTLWTGWRISATVPLADLPLLAELLPRLDNHLIEACAEWQCPTGLVVPLFFAGQVADLLPPVAARRAELAAAPGSPPAGSYPIIFDLPFRVPRYPARLILPTPGLGGYPHDDAAVEALLRSTTVNALGYLAGQIARTSRGATEHYLDALIARAEIRLGFSRPPDWPVTVHTYVPPDELAVTDPSMSMPARRPEIARRIQALYFLNYVLADQMPSADAALLQTLRRRSGLEVWLNSARSSGSRALIETYAAEITARFAAAGQPDWSQLNGLLYVCTDGAWLVREGQPTPLGFRSGEAWVFGDALSPDGAWLALVQSGLNKRPSVAVHRVADGSATQVPGPPGWPLDWTAEGELVYMVEEDRPQSEPFATNYRLFAYDPASGERRPIGPPAVMPPFDLGRFWSADQRSLALTVLQDSGGDLPEPVPAILTFAPGQEPQLRMLPARGYGASLSPDGRRLAYVAGGLPTNEDAPRSAAVEIFDLAAGRVLALPEAAEDAAEAAALPYSLVWSPDGARLAFTAYRAPGGAELWLFGQAAAGPLAPGAPTRLAAALSGVGFGGFSGDSRYVTYAAYDGLLGQLIVFELATGQAQPASGAAALDANWSPRGHLLAVATSGGLYVTDPATGGYQWITDRECATDWFPVSDPS